MASVLLVGLLISGCDFRRVSVNDPITPDRVAFLVPGQTTMPVVVARLGAPDEVTGSDGHLAFRYRFQVTKHVRINFGWVLRFWSPVSPSMNLSRADFATDVFQVDFDRSWTVTGSAFAYRSPEARFHFWPF